MKLGRGFLLEKRFQKLTSELQLHLPIHLVELLDLDLEADWKKEAEELSEGEQR